MIAEATIEQELADQIATGEYGPDPELPGHRRWVGEHVRNDEVVLPTYENARFGDGPMPEPVPGIPKDTDFVIHDPDGLKHRARLLDIEVF